MTAPAKINYKFYQGSTVTEILRWESTTKVYKPITGITNSAPVVINSLAHEIPNDWRVKITSVLGMTDINNVSNYYRVSNVTANTLTILDINSLGFKTYTGGGVLEYNKPIDLNGYTAVMRIKTKITDTNILYEASTSNGGIVIDNINKSISIKLSATTTSSFTFTSAVYTLILTSNNGNVIPLSSGTITMIKV
jgi:hypothetical protein